MATYTYKNYLISKKQLRKLLAWSFVHYDSMQACSLADELKYLGFQYATKAGISISIEDLKIPFVKNLMLEKANQEIFDAEKVYLKGRITEVERFQKIIDTWNLTSEALKNQIIYYFQNYDPLNSVYIMAFSGARGNLSQVRQLVGMRGLMSDPSGQIMNLPIKKNFREGLTITDYLMSGYGARKGIVDTALKTANSGYLTRRLIDVAQDIIIREKDCLTHHNILFSISTKKSVQLESVYEKIVGRILAKPLFDLQKKDLVAESQTQISPSFFQQIQKNSIDSFYIRSPLTCNLYRAICQKCYGWDLANENLVDIGEAIGILAGQSIGEPGTQLTMRTFHTGGIFTSKTRQQIISPINGIIQIYKNLKIVSLRTNRGEEVYVTKNFGSLIIIPTSKKLNFFQIEILRNTILFPKNNQYILKDTVIGEVINTNKQVKTEVKPILSDSSGEVFVPYLKQKVNVLNNNKLIWILEGQLYHSPINSFLNFYPDYKLNPNSYIFRTKLLNYSSGFTQFFNDQIIFSEHLAKIVNKKLTLINSNLQKLNVKFNFYNYLFIINNYKYLLKINYVSLKNYLKIASNQKLGKLLTNSFQTLTGGILYYDYYNFLTYYKENTIITYYNRAKKYASNIIRYRTIIWLEEETHKVKCEQNMLFVESGEFISQNFEIIPNLFSKTSGFVTTDLSSNPNIIIGIKSGSVYKGKNFENISNKFYYPGESLFSNIILQDLSFCEYINEETMDKLVVRPVKIYEFSHSENYLLPRQFERKYNESFSINFKPVYVYTSNQLIKGIQNLNLVSKILTFTTYQNLSKQTKIQLLNNYKKNSVNVNIIGTYQLTNKSLPNLRHPNIKSCFLIQSNQFINKYMVLGYLEAITLNSLEIVKFKTKKQITKQIFLISNNHCLSVKKTQLSNKKLNDFITLKDNLAKTGKIIIENTQTVTVQKGRPYFFPNCKSELILPKSNLQYKIAPVSKINSHFTTNKKISLNYYNILKLTIKQKVELKTPYQTPISLKTEFSKLFLKKNGKFYSRLVPQLFKRFAITTNRSKLQFNSLFKDPFLKTREDLSSNQSPIQIKKFRTILLKSSELVTNKNKHQITYKSNDQLILLKVVEQQFLKSIKAVGLYSITEDYFEHEVNSLFCKNTEFINEGKTIGLLNIEKEITGDIVQGLPRIEEILEARKKNILIKRIPTSKKKGVLTQINTLDTNFDFKKLGTPILENDSINPHKLLKVYFNYYGLLKCFLCEQKKQFQQNRLINNNEASYKSFKKVQLFILNSVQTVYHSQGVQIHDKHLEIIIKQMTTKVLITYEGDTPLLRHEVIDLYHIQYINKIMEAEMKTIACYVPLLLGITKAALNNPSFISAASFQETTRVLTKAAIEGRLDWLRGLKENIVVGHLIPAGTGSPNYRNSFKQDLPWSSLNYKTLINHSKLQ